MVWWVAVCRYLAVSERSGGVTSDVGCGGVNQR